MDAIGTRRSVRAYTEQRPGEDVIHTLLEAAVRAPTAMHLEPWGFAIVQDRAMLKRYSDRAKAALGEPPGHPEMLDDPDFNIFYDAGTLVVVCRRSSGPFADADCWLAAENLMLAAAEMGLGTCCIGFAVGVLNTPEAKRELNIPADGAAVAPIILGYPRGSVAQVPRKAPEILAWKKT
ncbi:MAG: nitroreductase family protein [Proteobacteria bacterium]|nr:nitroreductase family protein [Pseudomonadota bacterium]